MLFSGLNWVQLCHGTRVYHTYAVDACHNCLCYSWMLLCCVNFAVISCSLNEYFAFLWLLCALPLRSGLVSVACTRVQRVQWLAARHFVYALLRCMADALKCLPLRGVQIPHPGLLLVISRPWLACNLYCVINFHAIQRVYCFKQLTISLLLARGVGMLPCRLGCSSATLHVQADCCK